ncbi:hypothetical protein N658DRAFT_492163 [Parathielavia hyrcaniae]|uniref:Abscission/NoCut checkpoint regulator n=1 Tax=Parathielavia hyrcaniae TaxID=113614 RepID=A0AAN6QCF4_9PEZI|nr:hypothetical protein N658DRAFT_492163 [Parathielavia hyrcaniae]
MAPDDQSLLDRLNALKPTTVTLGEPRNTAILPVGPESQPPSREDALTKRLRILRDQSSSSSRHHEDFTRSQPPGTPDRDGVGADAAAPPSVERSASGDLPPQGETAGRATPVSQQSRTTVNQKSSSYHLAESASDDDAAVDELLEALGDEEFDLSTEDGLETPPDSNPSDKTEKVDSLLQSLGKGLAPSASTTENNNTPAEDDDDSDGEQMTRAVEQLLSQIGDEINALPPPTAAPTEGDNRRSQEAEDEPGAAPAPDNAKGDADDERAPLTLPAVPSQLVDPVPDTNSRDDFEKDISARLASLRGLGALDELGLPSAPTFRPQDYASASPPGRGLLKSSKYTDEDQQAWCIVCLDDATIRCVGCDNDGYCARCWKDMHIGPSAGFDERGHQWVKFERTGRP